VKIAASLVLLLFFALALYALVGCVSQEVRINTKECAEGEVFLGRICTTEDTE